MSDQALQEFAEDPRVLKLRTQASRQVESQKKRAFIEEQLSAAREFLRKNEFSSALAVLERGRQSYPDDARLASFIHTVQDAQRAAGLESQRTDALRQAKDEKAARRAADKLVSRMQKQGMRAEDMRDAARGFAQDSNDGTLPPIGAAALQKAVDAAFPRDTSQLQRDRLRDSLAVAYTAALAKPDSSAADDLRPKVVEAFSANTIAELSRKLAQAEAQNRSLRKRLDAARAEAKKGAGFVDTMAGAGGELVKLARKAGLGFGWLGLYFTGFVAMMRGQTPGKWLMRIRIVRLDGRPMGWWAALERFGGYAASVVTALSGFFQILWDKNRQAMHDKIAETVVVKA